MNQRPGGLIEPGPVSWLPLGLLVAGGSVLRSIHLNNDLWLDEIGTLVSYLRLPISEIVRTYGSMNQHLLYSVLGRVAVAAFGESAWAVRLPAVIFGILAIPAMYYMSRAITSEREALLGTTLLTFSYHHIWFSQDARGYSAMVFWTLLGSGLLFRAILRGGRWYWVGYTVAMTLGVVSLQNTFFVVAGQLCCFAALSLRDRRGLDWRAMAVSCASVAVLSLLCHSLMLGQMIQFFRTVDRNGLGWTKLTEFVPVVTNGLVLGIGLAGLAAAALLGVAGWWSYWRETRLVAGVLVLPVTVNLLALAVLHIGAYPRSFLYGLPFALLIAVRGATEWCRWLRTSTRAATVAYLLLAAAGSIPLIRYYRLPKQDFTGALRYVREHRTGTDEVMAADLAGVCYRRYYFPGMTVPETVEQIERARQAGHRVWVLYSFPRELKLRAPVMFDYLRRQDLAARFPGTLDGGDLYVARTK